MDPPAAPAVDAGAASSAFPAASPGVAPPAPALPVPPVPSLPSPFPAAFEPAALPAAAPAALREDQVQNAVGFLSHPQVRSSTNVASKRSFLERKGLTAAEIDEAFRRVPEAPAAAAAPAAPAAPVYAPPPAPAPAQVYAPAAVAAAPGAGPMVLAAAPPPVQPQGVRWSQIVLGVGVVAAAGWAVQALVLPRLRALLDSWSSSRREEEEARNKELTEAVAGLRGCQDELKTTTRALLEAVTLMRDQQRDQQRDVRGGGARGPATGPHDSVYASSSQPPAGRYGGGSGAGYGGMPDKGAYDNGRDSSYLRTEEFAAIRANAGTGYTNSYPPDASYVPPYGNRDGGTSADPTGGSAYGAVRTAANGPYGGGTGENLPYKVQAPPSPARATQSVSSRGPASGPGPYGGGPTPGPLGSTTSGSYGTYGGVPGDAVYGQVVSQGRYP
ncbi:hypothetical protein HYH03_010662 [Edaphochlamys debaryana]|uniref:Peroxisomal membrane protein PEX14 n=1 Tax=Edaphochlamys debaryana TaxID=47281 RepID=A0A836BW17_9CHLO|nr:hypothetical protein HYH03_010662 [Edaphochlamys debaryana]|eukprot:KAG2490990.1 hypothetical protein HYH03_010662 [Edaphochlamys debaryana]